MGCAYFELFLVNERPLDSGPELQLVEPTPGNVERYRALMLRVHLPRIENTRKQILELYTDVRGHRASRAARENRTGTLSQELSTLQADLSEVEVPRNMQKIHHRCLGALDDLYAGVLILQSEEQDPELSNPQGEFSRRYKSGTLSLVRTRDPLENPSDNHPDTNW